MGGIATGDAARHWRVALCLGALAAAVIAARPAAAGRNVWTAIGPDGGSVRSLAVLGAPSAIAPADEDGDGRVDLLAAVPCSRLGRPSCEGTAALTAWLAAP